MECFRELIIGPPPIVMKPSLPIRAPSKPCPISRRLAQIRGQEDSPLSAPSRRVHAKRRVPCSGGRSRPALAVRSVPVRRPTRRRSAGDGGPGRASHNTRNVRSQYRSAAPLRFRRQPYGNLFVHALWNWPPRLFAVIGPALAAGPIPILLFPFASGEWGGLSL